MHFKKFIQSKKIIRQRRSTEYVSRYSKRSTDNRKGNTSYISGKVIKIEDSLTKLVSSFNIEADEYEWSNGQDTMTRKLVDKVRK